MKIEASFIRSAASARDLPRDGLAEIALVGRSNVGKSSLINALVRRRLARTSGAPGKTRLANVYRVQRGAAAPFYLVDLPGYGYARAARPSTSLGTALSGSKGRQGRGGLSGAEGRRQAAREFAELTAAYFSRARHEQEQERPAPRQDREGREARVSALLLIDARHPGLENDIAAWTWLRSDVEHAAIVATKIDKLSRAERLRAIRTNEAVFDTPVLPVSAETGEGLDELWTLIDRLQSRRNPQRSSTMPAADRTAAAASPPRPPRKS